jgi:hypothetical protein
VRCGDRLPRTVRKPRQSRGGQARDLTEGGFTLIELIIVSLVLPLIIGTMTLALMSVFSQQTSTASRISGSSDAQVVSTNFETDVQDASGIVAPTGGAPTGQNPSTCGTGTEVISLGSGTLQGGFYPTEISYVEVAQGSGYVLIRNVCQGSNMTTPTSSSTVSFDVATGQTASVTCDSTLTSALANNTAYTALSVSALPAAVAAGDQIKVGSGASQQTFTAAATGAGATTLNVSSLTTSAAQAVGSSVVDTSWASNNCGATSGWISASNVTGVTFAVTEPSTGSGTTAYPYTLVALPRASSPPNPSTTVANPTATSCGFATLGTGTYASSLCFVDFTSYNAAKAAGPGCQDMAASIPGTSYTMSFCLSVSGGPVGPASFPTWTNAFLGNYIGGQPFYTGVPGNPALYQTDQGTTTTVTVTDIQVQSTNGTPATGWELVTGDAETTDAGESITWTSNQILNLLPNTPTSQVGDACSDPTSPDGLTGVNLTTNAGSLTVECASSESVSSPRTGTVMLGADTPTTLTVTLVGTGLQAMFLGLLLSS